MEPECSARTVQAHGPGAQPMSPEWLDQELSSVAESSLDTIAQVVVDTWTAQ